MFRATNIGYGIGKHTILHNIDLQVGSGQFVVLMGQNGAGKSSFLKIASGVVPPTEGTVTLLEKPLSQYTQHQLALKRAVLSQHYHIAFPLTVEQVVMMGRYPYFTSLPSQTDWDICQRIAQRLAIEHLWERNYQTLSGGEAQKVQMARILAQIGEDNDAPKLLLLDEPVSNLDIRYQHEILQIAKGFASQGGGVLAVLHDLHLAFRYADGIYFLKNGNLVYHWVKGEAPDLGLLNQVFDTQFHLSKDHQQHFLLTV